MQVEKTWQTMCNYQEQQKAWKPQQSPVKEEPRNPCHNPKAWSVKLMIALREEGPFATISSRELSAPSFARILNLKEMDSTTVYIFFVLNRF